MLTSRQGGPARRRRLPVFSTCIALALCAVAGPAHAKPPAAGAPGAIHTWPPADKQGFATAHQLAGNAYLTLRNASLTEVYYPDLSTPSFRSLGSAGPCVRTPDARARAPGVPAPPVHDVRRGLRERAAGGRRRRTPNTCQDLQFAVHETL